MKKLATLLAVVLSLTGLVTLESCQSAKNSTASKMLKFNFETGKGYDYEMIINMDLGATMQMDMSNYYSMDVVGEEGGAKTINTTYDRFKMKMNVSGFNIEVDSDKPLPSLGITGDGEDPMKTMSAILGAIKGRKFSMKVNAEGKVIEVKGFEEMAKTIADSIGGDPARKQKIMEEFSKQFSDKTVGDQFERVLYIFPNKVVKVGDSWQKTTNPGGAMGGTYNSTYTVTDIEGDMVTLEEKSKIEGASEGMTMKGTIEGVLVVDSRSGLVVNADQEMNIKSGSKGESVDIKGKTKIKGKARD